MTMPGIPFYPELISQCLRELLPPVWPDEVSVSLPCYNVYFVESDNSLVPVANLVFCISKLLTCAILDFDVSE